MRRRSRDEGGRGVEVRRRKRGGGSQSPRPPQGGAAWILWTAYVRACASGPARLRGRRAQRKRRQRRRRLEVHTDSTPHAPPHTEGEGWGGRRRVGPRSCCSPPRPVIRSGNKPFVVSSPPLDRHKSTSREIQTRVGNDASAWSDFRSLNQNLSLLPSSIGITQEFVLV